MMKVLNILQHISRVAALSNESFRKGSKLAPQLAQVSEGHILLQNFANIHGVKMSIYLMFALTIAESVFSGILLVPLVESISKDNFFLSFGIAMTLYFVLLYALSMIAGNYLFQHNPHLVELNNKLDTITNPEKLNSLLSDKLDKKSNKHLIIGGISGLSFVLLMGLLATFRNYMINGHSGEIFNSPDDLFLFAAPVILSVALIYLSKWKGVYGKIQSFSKQVTRMTAKLDEHKSDTVSYGQKLLDLVRQSESFGLSLPTDADTSVALARIKSKDSTDPDFFTNILPRTLTVYTISQDTVMPNVLLRGCTANGIQLHTRSDENGKAVFSFTSSPNESHLVYIKTANGVSLPGSHFECGQDVYFDISVQSSKKRELINDNEPSNEEFLNELDGLPITLNGHSKASDS